MCKNRASHPILTFRDSMMIDSNESVALFTENIDRKIPVAICALIVIPNRNPMFHSILIDVGVGRSTREE